MAKYVLLYMGGNEPQTDAERASVTNAWTDWFTTLGKAIVDPGNPFMQSSKKIASNGAVSNGAAAPAQTQPTGYSILSAESLDKAAKLAQGCPHLKSGGNISVFETFEVM